MAHDLDMTWRYAPTKVMTLRGVMPVERAVIHPAGSHSGTRIHKDMTALELVTKAGSRWYGIQDGFINSELRMVVRGFDPRFEEVMRWEEVPKDARDGRSFGSHLLAIGAGYAIARMVDNPEKVRSAARATASEARKFGSSVKKMTAKEGSSSGDTSLGDDLSPDEVRRLSGKVYSPGIYVDMLRKNARQYHQDGDYDRFSKKNRRIWSLVEREGREIQLAVLEELRARGEDALAAEHNKEGASSGKRQASKRAGRSATKKADCGCSGASAGKRAAPKKKPRPKKKTTSS